MVRRIVRDACVIASVSVMAAFAGPAAPTHAAAQTAAPRADAGFGWLLQLRAPNHREDVSASRFRILATQSGLGEAWTDDAGTPGDVSDDHIYAGLPLWRLVARVDDDRPVSFNDALAGKDYAIQIFGYNGSVTTLSSSVMRRNDGILVADRVDNAPPLLGSIVDPDGTPSFAPAWPLCVTGPATTPAERFGGVLRIVIYKPGVTPPSTPSAAPWGWVLQLRGPARTEDMTGARFRSLAGTGGQGATWTDDAGTPADTGDDHVYGGLPLWRLLARVDDGNAATFNENLAGMDYDITVRGLDGSTAAFKSSEVARSRGVIVADRKDGAQLSSGAIDGGGPDPVWRPAWPSSVVGSAATAGQRIGGVARIVAAEPVYPSYTTTLTLKGRLTRSIPYAKFPTKVTWDGTKAGDINPTLLALYKGQTLYRLVCLVDDRDPSSFNTALARKHYKIRFTCRDGYIVNIDSASIIGKKGWIVASLKDGRMLSDKEGPYRYVGSFIKPFYGKLSANQITRIDLVFKAD